MIFRKVLPSNQQTSRDCWSTCESLIEYSIQFDSLHSCAVQCRAVNYSQKIFLCSLAVPESKIFFHPWSSGKKATVSTCPFQLFSWEILTFTLYSSVKVFTELWFMLTVRRAKVWVMWYNQSARSIRWAVVNLFLGKISRRLSLKQSQNSCHRCCRMF